MHIVRRHPLAVGISLLSATVFVAACNGGGGDSDSRRQRSPHDAGGPRPHAQPGQVILNTLQTNATLIDDAWARFLGDNGFLVGVSIDERPAHGGEAGPTKPGARRGAGRDAGWRILRAASGWSAVALLAAAATLAWTAARARPDGLLHLHLPDIGQGDSLLLVSPNGRRLLIDGGPSGATLLAQMGRLQAPWDKHLDLVLLTHPDADHVGGLSELLRRYAVDAILDPELEAETPDAEEWRATLAERPVPRHRASAGGRIVLDEAAGVTGDILWPPEPRLTGVASPTNENAVVLRLTYGATSALFTGDIGADAEAALLARGAPLTADVLKLGHHGSAGSSTAPFLAAVLSLIHI